MSNKLLIVVAAGLSSVELVALWQGVDGAALAAYWGAMGAILGFGGSAALPRLRQKLQRRKK